MNEPYLDRFRTHIIGCYLFHQGRVPTEEELNGSLEDILGVKLDSKWTSEVSAKPFEPLTLERLEIKAKKLMEFINEIPKTNPDGKNR